MPTINFTARAVESLQPATRRTEYWDENLPGFGIRISPDGTKSWVLMYRFEGRQRRFTIGRYPARALAEVRDTARGLLVEAARGSDPATRKQSAKEAETFEELADEYLVRHAKAKKRSWREDERLINRELLPAWRFLKASAVTRRHVICLIDKVMDRGAPIQANRLLALTRKVFNFGIQRDLVGSNPCWQVALPAVERQRDRVLSPSELRALWTAIASDESLFRYFKILLLTAQRPGEVLNMRWDDVDLVNGWWVIPGDSTKNGLPHRVPFGRLAVLSLREAKLLSGSSEWVFPGRSWAVKEKRKNRVNLKGVLRQLRDASGVDFRAHDLRRTAASYMTASGISRLTVSKILNHVERSVTAVYDRHSYDSEKRAALDRWAQTIEKLDFPVVEHESSCSVSPSEIYASV